MTINAAVSVLVLPVRSAKTYERMDVRDADGHRINFVTDHFRNACEGEVTGVQIHHVPRPQFEGHAAMQMYKPHHLHLHGFDGQSDAELTVQINGDQIFRAIRIDGPGGNLKSRSVVAVLSGDRLPVDHGAAEISRPGLGIEVQVKIEIRG